MTSLSTFQFQNLSQYLSLEFFQLGFWVSKGGEGLASPGEESVDSGEVE